MSPSLDNSLISPFIFSDTKLLAKSIISEIVLHARTFAFDSHKHGRRALLYLLVPRSPRHFTPATNVLLAETDAARARTSKKDADVREREIRAAASEGRGGLLHLAEEKMDDMIRDPGASLLLAEILLYSEGGMLKTSILDHAFLPTRST